MPYSYNKARAKKMLGKSREEKLFTVLYYIYQKSGPILTCIVKNLLGFFFTF